MKVDYVIASGTEDVAAACRAALGGIPGVDIRTGSVPETGGDCDAAILNGPLAHERYGGVPRKGEVQVLANRLKDGAPPVILAAAPRALDAAVTDPDDAEIEDYVQDVLASCVSAFAAEFPDRDEVRVLVHLEGAALDRPAIEVPLRSIRRFLTESRS
ncbi:hypothetical protein ABZ464_22845 [Streptomyces sp. NPDC005820]|uniref:hypothetical protein n=1 Tax=Streptomyces sp. NPDC005820 TaxID=3157069 RepID=UPI0033D45FFD